MDTNTSYHSITESPTNPTFTQSTSPSPSIFIKTEVTYHLFYESIKSLFLLEGFICKSSINCLKLNHIHNKGIPINNKVFKKKILTFTLKIWKVKSYRMVIRHLHHSTPVDWIQNELKSISFTTRNITNFINGQTKTLFPLFFVDFESILNNRYIFKIDTFYYTEIKIEEPWLRRNIVQCTRCQPYSLKSSQMYCYHYPRCVRSVKNYLSNEDQKNKNSSVKCVLYNKLHKANYRGYQVFKDFKI